MQCFIHHGEPAVGVCRSCHKAVCDKCLIDTGKGLACSEECKKDILETDKVIGINKKVYGVGQDKKRIQPGVVINGCFAAVFLGMAAFIYFTTSKVEYFLLVMGLVFAGITIYVYRRARELGLNC